MLLLDRVTYLSQARYESETWDIEMIGFAVCIANDDVMANAASFTFSGSDRARKFFDARNVKTNTILGEMETILR
jgi:hypothetical protein